MVDDPRGRPGLPGRRLPVRPAGAAAGGFYLALATFALAVATPQILKYKGIEHWTGGVQGIVIVKPPAPFGLPISPDKWLYLFALAVAVVMFVLGVGILRGRVGRALIAIRDHPTAAAAMGVNTALYKSLTFGVSALYTGVGGALSALAIQFVAPDSFGFFLSISFLVGIVVGGLASVSGAVFGALFIQFIPNVADTSLQVGPLGGVRRFPDCIHVLHADRCRRRAANDLGAVLPHAMKRTVTDFSWPPICAASAQ